MNAIEEAEKIIRETKVMQLVDYEKETLCFITPETPLFAASHRQGVKYLGCNLYALIDSKLTLLETYDDVDNITGKELCDNVIESIRKGFDAGATYYIMPAN